MKKLLLLCIFIPLFGAVDPRNYTVDLINKSQFPVNVKISKTPTYISSRSPKQYTTVWDLKPGVTKVDQILGWKDQYSYEYLIVTYGVNYGGQSFGITKIKKIPKKYRDTNDFIATIDIQKKTGEEATKYINNVIKKQYPYSNQAENIALNQQKGQGWAWVPVITFAGK